MLGSISTALVLGAAREADMADFLSSKGVCHEWRCQALVRLTVFDSRLGELDSTLLSFAGPRGAEGIPDDNTSAPVQPLRKTRKRRALGIR